METKQKYTNGSKNTRDITDARDKTDIQAHNSTFNSETELRIGTAAYQIAVYNPTQPHAGPRMLQK